MLVFREILRTCYMNDSWTFLHWIPTGNRNKVKIYPERVFLKIYFYFHYRVSLKGLKFKL